MPGRRSAVLITVGLLALPAGGCDGDDASAARPEAQIAFSANQGGAPSVVLVEGDGGARSRVKEGVRSPSWSPDGRRLAVTRVVAERDSDIALIDVDGRRERRLTSGSERDDDPAFSPDGGRVAFSRIGAVGDGPLMAALHVVRADGSGLRRVTRSRGLDRQPAWSPDGRRIAFTRINVRGRRFVPEVMVVAAGGGAARAVVKGMSPAWSPDGHRIAYVTGADDFGETCFHECSASGEIHVVGADGRGDERITRSRADDTDPEWTADGRQIVFSSDRSDRLRHDRELWAMGADGSCPTRLTNASSSSSEPAWRPGAEGPAACEAGGVADGARQATMDVDLGPARDFSAYPLFWLGERHRDLMLADARRMDGGFADFYSFVYDDCARTGSASCPASVQVQSQPLCWWKNGPAPVRLRRVGTERGAPVYAHGRETGEYAQAEIHTGESAVRVIAEDGAALRRALSRIRPLDGEVGPLAPPARECG